MCAAGWWEARQHQSSRRPTKAHTHTDRQTDGAWSRGGWMGNLTWQSVHSQLPTRADRQGYLTHKSSSINPRWWTCYFIFIFLLTFSRQYSRRTYNKWVLVISFLWHWAPDPTFNTRARKLMLNNLLIGIVINCVLQSIHIHFPVISPSSPPPASSL